MTPHADRCTFRVAWSDVDGEYVGTIAEFDGSSHRSSTAQGPLANIQQRRRDLHVLGSLSLPSAVESGR